MLKIEKSSGFGSVLCRIIDSFFYSVFDSYLQFINMSPQEISKQTRKTTIYRLNVFDAYYNYYLS